MKNNFFFQDGVVITPSDHFVIDLQDGVCTLIIPNVREDDESEFMCEAKNEAGVATTWAELILESKHLGLTLQPPSASQFLPHNTQSHRCHQSLSGLLALRMWAGGVVKREYTYDSLTGQECHKEMSTHFRHTLEETSF